MCATLASRGAYFDYWNTPENGTEAPFDNPTDPVNCEPVVGPVVMLMAMYWVGEVVELPDAPTGQAAVWACVMVLPPAVIETEVTVVEPVPELDTAMYALAGTVEVQVPTVKASTPAEACPGSDVAITVT
jgi:hypothetical protein